MKEDSMKEKTINLEKEEDRLLTSLFDVIKVINLKEDDSEESFNNIRGFIQQYGELKDSNRKLYDIMNELVNYSSITKERLKKEILDKKIEKSSFNDSLKSMRENVLEIEKRSQREIEKEKFNVKIDVISKMLEIIDNLDLVLDAFAVKNVAISNIKDGIQITRDRAEFVFSQSGLKQISVNIGDKYDVNIHKAIDIMNEHISEGETTVLKVVKKGYMLNSTVLRPALVIVEKKAK